MADTTYQPKIYRKQGGDEFVVANGGAITVESGGDVNIESGGGMTAEDGSVFDVAENGSLGYFDTDFTGACLRLRMLSLATSTRRGASTSAHFSGLSNPPDPAYGTYNFSAATAFSEISMALPSAEVGAILIFNFADCVGDANASVCASAGSGITGVSLVDEDGVAWSNFNASAGAYVVLACATAGTWAVIERNAAITGTAAA